MRKAIIFILLLMMVSSVSATDCLNDGNCSTVLQITEIPNYSLSLAVNGTFGWEGQTIWVNAGSYCDKTVNDIWCEDFEDNDISDWTSVGSGALEVDSTSKLSGIYSLKFYGGGASSQDGYSPEFTNVVPTTGKFNISWQVFGTYPSTNYDMVIATDIGSSIDGPRTGWGDPWGASRYGWYDLSASSYFLSSYALSIVANYTIVADTDTDTFAIYINNVLQDSSATGSGSISYSDIDTIRLISYGTNFNYIDNIRVYNSSSETNTLSLAYNSVSDYAILDANNNTVPFETEQTGYGFDTKSVYPYELMYLMTNRSPGDTIAWDSTGNYDGTITGATVVDGVNGKGLSFDGTNDYISIGNIGSDIQTLSFYINLTTTTESILEETDNVGVSVSSGTMSYSNWDNCFIDSVDTDTISTGWHLVTLTSTTGVTMTAFRLGLLDTSYLDADMDNVIADDRAWSANEIEAYYNNSQNLNMLLDSGVVPPETGTVIIYEPENNSIQYSNVLDVLFYYNLNTTCYLDINGSYYDDLPNNEQVNSTFNYSMATPGDYSFTVRCLNSTTNVTQVVTYATYPVFTDIPTAANLEYKVDGLNVDFNATAFLGIYNWFVNDTTNFVIDSAGVLTNNTILSIGNYKVNVSVNDTNNGITSTTYNVTVTDTTAPAWTVIPANETFILGDDTTFSVVYTAVDDTEINNYYVNNTDFSINATGTLINTTSLVTGDYYFTVSVDDIFNNFNYSDYHLRVVAISEPVITYPVNNTYYNITDFTIRVENNLSYYDTINCTLNNDGEIIYYNNRICYQETATTATSCGGLSTGSYSYNSELNNPLNSYDEDWNTYSDTIISSSTGELYINYKIPESFSIAIWEVKTLNRVNVTILNSCLTYNDDLQLKIDTKFIAFGELTTNYYCYNGSWQTIYTILGENRIYEEGIYWGIPNNEYNFNVSYIDGKPLTHNLEASCYGDEDIDYRYNTSIVFYTDIYAPTSVLSMVDSGTGGPVTDDVWTNATTVNAVMYCADNPSGNASGCAMDVQYCYDLTNTCEPNTTYAGIFINTIGVNYLRYYSVDKAGNYETLNVVKVKITNNSFINITWPDVPEYHINETTYFINMTVDEYSNCSLYVNSVYQTDRIVSKNVNTQFDITLTEGQFDYYFECAKIEHDYFTGLNETTTIYSYSAIQNLTIDITLPAMTPGSNDLYNTSYYTSTVLSNFTVGDAHLLLCDINATCEDGTNIFSKQYYWGDGTISALLTDTITHTGCGDKGFVTVLRQCADTHTNDKISKIDVKKDLVKKELSLKVKKDKYVKIKAVDSELVEDFEVIQKIDRVSYKFIMKKVDKTNNGNGKDKKDKKVKKEYIDINVEGSNLKKMTGTGYLGHFVEWEGFETDENGVPLSRWLDFENENNYNVDVLSTDSVRVYCGIDNCEKDIVFNSYGSLNINEETFVYYYNLNNTVTMSESYTNPIVVNFSTTYNLNVTTYNDVLYPTNWTWDNAFEKPAAILELYGTNITQNYTATTTSLYTIDSYTQTYDTEVTDGTIYFNYSKPFSNDLAIWKVKHGAEDTYNITLPLSCMNDTIQVKMESYYGPTTYYSKLYCLTNGNFWQSVGKTDSGTDSLSSISISDGSNVYDGDWTTGELWYVALNKWYKFSSGSTSANLYEQGMYFGNKKMEFEAKILVPGINNTYNSTNHKWHYFMTNVTNTENTFDSDEQSQTVYQAIINVKTVNINSFETLYETDIHILSANTSKEYEETNTTSEWTTLYVNAGNQELSVSKTNYSTQYRNFTLAYGQNYSITVDLPYLVFFNIWDESTLEAFNISSAERVQFILHCKDDRVNEVTVENATFQTVIDCKYDKYQFVLDYADGVTYYRTWLSDEGGQSTNEIFLIDFLTTSYIANTFTIDDLLSDYENVSIWINRNLAGNDYVITSDLVDIEQKITTWLMTNREYTVVVKSDNRPDRVIGIYTASTTGNKAIKLYDISLNNPPLTFNANVVYAIQNYENLTDNRTETVFTYIDEQELTDSVTFSIYETTNLNVPIATYSTTANEVYYTYDITNMTDVSLIGKIEIVRGEDVGEYTNYVNSVTEIPYEIINKVGFVFLNWFFIILLGGIAIMATYSTAPYMNFVISGISLLVVIFGWFQLSKALIGFALLVSIISLYSAANKRPDE